MPAPAVKDFGVLHRKRVATRLLSLLWRLEVVVIGDVWDTDDENPHPAKSAVNDSRRDVNQGTLGNGMLDAIEKDTPAALENVVKLGGTLVVMEFGTVDVHGVCPCCRRK